MVSLLEAQVKKPVPSTACYYACSRIMFYSTANHESSLLKGLGKASYTFKGTPGRPSWFEEKKETFSMGKTRKMHRRPIGWTRAACEGWITGSAKETCRNLQRLLIEVIKGFLSSSSWAVPSVEQSFLTSLLVPSWLQIPFGWTMWAFCSTRHFFFSIDILKHTLGMLSMNRLPEFDDMGHCWISVS